MEAHTGEPTTNSLFCVSTATYVLFNRLPLRLKEHIAYRHFYTDEIDPKAQAVSIKFFSLFILYFTSLFNLNVKRVQYTNHESENAGEEFAAAHLRAQRVFQNLTNIYSLILMRYNCNSELSYTVQHALMARGRNMSGPYCTGLKKKPALINTDVTFQYSSDEAIFYEYLLVITLQIVRMAFDELKSISDAAERQIIHMFRSGSFTFGALQRYETVRKLSLSYERQALSLTENTEKLAELLTPENRKIVIKYAARQRSPFIAARYPYGGTSFMKYQRPYRTLSSTLISAAAGKLIAINTTNSKTPPTLLNEQQYMIKTKEVCFPLHHRAMIKLKLYLDRLRSGRFSNCMTQLPSTATLTPLSSPAFMRSGASSPTASPVPLLPQIHRETFNNIKNTSGSFQKSCSSSVPNVDETILGIKLSPKCAAASQKRQQKLQQEHALFEEREEHFHKMLQSPFQQWIKRSNRTKTEMPTDDIIIADIEAISKSLVAEVPEDVFALPPDLMVVYDETGILEINPKTGDPLSVE